MIQAVHVINLSPDQPTDQYTPQLTENIKRWREERALSIVKQSKEHGFAVRFWAGITDNDTFRCENISRAFKKIVQYAKEERLESVTIAEDDMILTAMGAWKYYNQNIPTDYDIYSGGIYYGKIEGGRILSTYSGNTLITVHERFYDFFLSADEKLNLDNWLGFHAQEKKYIVCEPFVVRQPTESYSENKRRINSLETYENWAYYSGG